MHWRACLLIFFRQVRPILMQLDLPSFEKIPFSTSAWAFDPDMLETSLPRLITSRSFLQDRSRAVSRFSSWPVAGNHVEHFFDPTRVKIRLQSELSPASTGPSCRNHRHLLVDPTGSNTITIPDRIDIRLFVFPIRWTIVIVFDPVGSKKFSTWCPATGPLEKRETALYRSWSKLRLILRGGRPISYVFGVNTHANALKGTFSTNCKSNCIRIGRFRFFWIAVCAYRPHLSDKNKWARMLV